MSVELDESGGGSRGRALSTEEGAEQLERVLRSTVDSGHVGALSLDPKYFVFEAAARKCDTFFIKYILLLIKNNTIQIYQNRFIKNIILIKCFGFYNYFAHYFQS